MDNQIISPNSDKNPASPAQDIPQSGKLANDSPLTDTGMDSDEVYQEGVDAAAGIVPDEELSENEE